MIRRPRKLAGAGVSPRPGHLPRTQTRPSAVGVQRAVAHATKHGRTAHRDLAAVHGVHAATAEAWCDAAVDAGRLVRDGAENVIAVRTSDQRK